jgi:hypothetical protein
MDETERRPAPTEKLEVPEGSKRPMTEGRWRSRFDEGDTPGGDIPAARSAREIRLERADFSVWPLGPGLAHSTARAKPWGTLYHSLVMMRTRVGPRKGERRSLLTGHGLPSEGRERPHVRPMRPTGGAVVGFAAPRRRSQSAAWGSQSRRRLLSSSPNLKFEVARSKRRPGIAIAARGKCG